MKFCWFHAAFIAEAVQSIREIDAWNVLKKAEKLKLWEKYSVIYIFVQKVKGWLRAQIARYIHVKNTIMGFLLKTSLSG